LQWAGSRTGAVRSLSDAADDERADEIDAVIVYLRARVIGRRGITPEECAYYYEELAGTWCDPDQEK